MTLLLTLPTLTHLDKRHDNKTTKKDASESSLENFNSNDAVKYGLDAMQELLLIKEPQFYQMGLFLDENDPASYVAKFGAPNKKAELLSRVGFASVAALKRLSELDPQHLARQATGASAQQLLSDECPLRGRPRCRSAAQRYRTADGTCNNEKRPWRGAALLPMQRFLPPVYHDGIQQVRRSVFGDPLPSPRLITTTVHREKNLESPDITLMLMQWGQLVDHDLTSTVKSRSFNGTVPRCCTKGSRAPLPIELQHPNCMPIQVPRNDRFYSQFGIGCIEFTRSAPSTRIDCDLGWREQLNQVTSYLDASAIYGSDVETSDAMRTFRDGQLFYGRVSEPLQPPDPPGGELCRSGALTSDCLSPGDGRLGEQPGLTALHTVFLRHHNNIAGNLSRLNLHWSDEKVYQESRKIIGGLVQQITFREFLPLVLGPQVVDAFGLKLLKKGYYDGYNDNVDATIANSFSSAAFRFGHSLVQNSFLRYDAKHRPLFNNVTLHEEFDNVENIWSLGSLDRLLLGMANQPIQRRDEHISSELTNHLFQSADPSAPPFGIDLASINIQRGRDHGLPPYTAFRKPCGLSSIHSWSDLHRIMDAETANRLKNLYSHYDDVDLFTGALGEKPIKGAIVGPTLACIIAQQFSNLRQGDRFWYENEGEASKFTPAQLQQIRRVTLSHIICQTCTEIETLQSFIFQSPSNRNRRQPCDVFPDFDLNPWIERPFQRTAKRKKSKTRTTTQKTRKPTRRPTTTTQKPLKLHVTNITRHTVSLQDKQYGNRYKPVATIPNRPTFDQYGGQPDITYLVDYVKTTTTTPRPIEFNIKIQYYPPTTPTTTKPSTKRPNNLYVYPTRKPTTYIDRYDNNYDMARPLRPSYATAHIEKISSDSLHDRLTFHDDKPTTADQHDYNDETNDDRFVKISSVHGQQYHDLNNPNIHLFISQQREGDLDLLENEADVRLVDVDIEPDDNRWVFYNATDNDSFFATVHLPDSNFSCTDEIPKPMTKI